MMHQKAKQLEDLDAITPGMFIRIVQVHQLEGGLLFDADPDVIYSRAVEHMREEFTRQGYGVILDREITGSVAGVPFALEQLADIGGPISGWIPAGTNDQGEPAFELFFQWLVVDVQDPDPATLEAGWPFIIVGAALAIGFLFGTSKVIEESRQFFESSSGDALDLLEQGTQTLVVLGVLVLAVLIIRQTGG